MPKVFTDWRQMIEKTHLAASDLVDDAGNPKEFTVEISWADSKLLKTREKPDGEMKCVLGLKGAKKAFVSNSTNCRTIEKIYGTKNPNKWIGKKITIYPTDVRVGRETLRGIRVKNKLPTGVAEKIDDQPVDEAMVAARNEAFGREPGED